MSKVGIVKIRQATRPSIVSQNYSAKIDISDLSGVNLGGIKEGDILVYSANTGNFEVRTASISGNNDSALTQYAANHANSAFAYANTISGGSAIDNVARVAATSAGVYANLAYNHANAAFNAANTGGAAGVDTYARNHANAAFAYANTISGGSAIDNVARTSAASAETKANSAYNHANAAFEAANSGSSSVFSQSAYNHANAAFSVANNSLSINTGGIVAGAITVTNLVSNSFIQFGDGSRQYTANAGTGGSGGGNSQDYFPTDTNWGFLTSTISAFGENLDVQYDCRDEPITPRGYLLQKDFGYLT